MTIYYTGFEPDDADGFATQALEYANSLDNAFGVTFECRECPRETVTPGDPEPVGQAGITSGLSTQDPVIDAEYFAKLEALFRHVRDEHGGRGAINMRVNRPFARIVSH